MGNVRIELNSEGVRNLLRSQEMKNICEEYARQACNELGEGYEVTTYTGKKRVNASIYAKTIEAQRDNLENNSILKVLR